jgi:hypothetical protein
MQVRVIEGHRLECFTILLRIEIDRQVTINQRAMIEIITNIMSAYRIGRHDAEPGFVQETALFLVAL